MSTLPFGWPRIHLDSIESTMPAIAQLALSGANHGTVITADFQSAGTGRDRRAWVAPPGSSLLMSVLIKTRRPLNEIPVVSLLIGGCVCDTLAEFRVQTSIKWPNDVLAHDKKMSGILVRTSRSSHGDGHDLVVGVGLNVTAGSTVGLPMATNLESESGSLVPMNRLLDRLLDSMGRMAEHFEQGKTAAGVARIDDRLAFRGELISIDLGSRIVRGTVEGIRNDGALIVLTADGTRQFVVSGELQRGPQPQEPV